MSLINDALKRASTSRPVLSEAAVVPVMHPVVEPAAARGGGPLPIVLFIVGVGALLVSGAFWLKSKGTPVQTATAVIPEPAAKIATPAPAPALVAVEKVVPTNLVLPAVTAIVPVEAPAPSPAASSAVAEPVAKQPIEKISAPAPLQPKPIAAPPVEQSLVEAQPELSLQAIYYRMKGPTVVINGKTLKPGDKIEGAKLVVIERNAAIVEFQGTHRRLTIQ